MKTQFYNWLKETKTHITKPEKYANTITTISNHFHKSLNRDVDLYKINDATELSKLREEYFSYDIFYLKNQTGNRMYSRSIDLYIEFLETNKTQFDDAENEVEKINQDSTLSSLQKETIILSRIGQGKYRDELIKIWNGCAISRFNDVRFLIASHIKPWKKSTNEEKIDKYNGLLLLPTFDKLFDLGFISFDDNGKIIISKYLIDYEKLGINESIVINIKYENIKYLSYHRDNIFKR